MIKIQHHSNRMQIRLLRGKISKIFLKRKTKNWLQMKNQTHSKSLQASKDWMKKFLAKKIKKRQKNNLYCQIKIHKKRTKIYQTRIRTIIAYTHHKTGLETHLLIEAGLLSITMSLYSTFISKIKTNLIWRSKTRTKAWNLNKTQNVFLM